MNSVNVYQQGMPAQLSTTSLSSAVPQSSVLAPEMGYRISSKTSTGSVPAATGALTSVVPQNLVLGYGMGGGASNITSTIISSENFPKPSLFSSSSRLWADLNLATYIDICDICANGYSTITTAVTFGHCGCRDAITVPTIPMTTVTKSCSCCVESGSPAVAIVMVPCVSVSQAVSIVSSTAMPNGTGTSMTTIGGPAKFTGGSKTIDRNLGLVFAGLILIAIL